MEFFFIIAIIAIIFYFYIGYIKKETKQNHNNNQQHNNNYRNNGYWYKGKYYSNNKKYDNSQKDESFVMPTELPYVKRDILTKTEYEFYILLKIVCDHMKLIVCPKVRMEDFLSVTDKIHRKKYRGYIKSRHIDFIICDKDMKMLAGVELDDNSHNKTEAQKIDEFKNKVFQKINIPLFRVKTSYDKAQYKTPIINILKQLGCIKAAQQTSNQNMA